MIRSLYLDNDRALKNFTLTLGPLTALVGPNASGKSSALPALRNEPLVRTKSDL